eukprot:4610154-Amphidinium_carterae.2
MEGCFSTNQVWKKNNTRDFLVYDEVQKLLVEVYDYDFFTPDDVAVSASGPKNCTTAPKLQNHTNRNEI